MDQNNKSLKGYDRIPSLGSKEYKDLLAIMMDKINKTDNIDFVDNVYNHETDGKIAGDINDLNRVANTLDTYNEINEAIKKLMQEFKMR